MFPGGAQRAPAVAEAHRNKNIRQGQETARNTSRHFAALLRRLKEMTVGSAARGTGPNEHAHFAGDRRYQLTYR